jgi:hypothetical protein
VAVDSLPGALWAAGKGAGAYVSDRRPWRVVLHTTEGADVPLAAYARNGWPHLTFKPATRQVWQHLNFDVAATAMRNAPGGVETNRCWAIQIEIVGFAAGARDWPNDWCDWIGEQLAALRHIVPFVLRAPRFVDQRDGFIARTDAPQRFSNDEWLTFDGVCGHQHVPENDHWDPGAIRIDRILAAAEGSAKPAPNEEEEPMKVILFGLNPVNGRQPWAEYQRDADQFVVFGAYTLDFQNTRSLPVPQYGVDVVKLAGPYEGHAPVDAFDWDRVDRRLVVGMKDGGTFDFRAKQ